MPHLLVHSPDGGRVGGLHAFVSNATANTGMRVLVLFLSDSHPEVELLGHMKVKSLSRVQLFATLWTVARRAAGSSVHGIFQARMLEWVAIFFSRGSSRPRDQTW